MQQQQQGQGLTLALPARRVHSSSSGRALRTRSTSRRSPARLQQQCVRCSLGPPKQRLQQQAVRQLLLLLLVMGACLLACLRMWLQQQWHCRAWCRR